MFDALHCTWYIPESEGSTFAAEAREEADICNLYDELLLDTSSPDTNKLYALENNNNNHFCKIQGTLIEKQIQYEDVCTCKYNRILKISIRSII